MKPRTIDGVTKPDPSKPDCLLLDRVIDLLLLYQQYEGDVELAEGVSAQDAVGNTIGDLRLIAERFQQLRAAKGGPLPGQKEIFPTPAAASGTKKD